MTRELAPDRDQIRLHLEVLFAELVPGALYEGGLFELRFLHPTVGNPKGHLFDGAEIAEAIDLAVQKNAAGWNAYVGVNPRKPGTAGYGKTQDIERADWQFVDCDDGESSKKLQELPFPPNYVVTTGTRPHQRLHGYYMLDGPELNLEAFTSRQEALAACIDGDSTVKDPPRIMRLAGTISYPTADKLKRGYEVELVTISEIDPHAWNSEDLDRLAASETSKDDSSVEQSGSMNLDNLPPTDQIVSLLKQSKEAGRWHNSMRSATARLLLLGHSPERVAEICAPYCKGGAEDTDLKVLISSAVDKGIFLKPAPTAQQILLETPRDRGNLLSRRNIIKMGEARYVTEQNYLIKNWLPYDGIGVLFGPSNTGKTFVALGMAASVAAGIPWHDHKVQQGAVLYLATEGSFSFSNRMTALHEDLGLDEKVPLIARTDMVNLLDPEGNLGEIKALADEIKADYGPLRMIVVDTLARAMAGGNENAPDDMTKLINNVDALRKATGAFILLIHHTGKDETRGARGHSSLQGAADAMLSLKPTNDVIKLASEKQRDMPEPSPKAFQLEVVPCGEDEDGDPVTTGLIRNVDALNLTEMKRPNGANQTMLMECYQQLRLEKIGQPNPDGAGFPETGRYWCIHKQKLRDHFNGKYAGSNSSSAFSSAFEGLSKKGLICMNGELVWLPTDQGKV